MDQAGSVAGGEVGPDAKQNGADWRDTSRVRPAQIVPRHTQGWVLVHLGKIRGCKYGYIYKQFLITNINMNIRNLMK